MKADPKSRLFYPLAEELRKIGQFTEAESVLRGGLGSHPTYLSAWVSLGRVLRELKKDGEAVEALSKALTLDPGNVVAARLLADAYMARGEKLEALKKYKLVHALLPADQELEAMIARLDQELNPPPPPPAPPAPSPVPASLDAPAFVSPELFDQTEPDLEPTVEQPIPIQPASPVVEEESPWDVPSETPMAAAEQSFATEEEVAIETGDAEPMSVAHDESPFEDPGVDAGYGSDALLVEAPEGFHLAQAPLAAELPEPFGLEDEVPIESAPIESPLPSEEPEEAEIFALATEAIVGPEETTETITMADLYARQGFTEDARVIYEHILQRDPDNGAVRRKLEALGPARSPAAEPIASAPEPAMEDDEPEPPPQSNDLRTLKVRKLKNWLAKVARRVEDRV